MYTEHQSSRPQVRQRHPDRRNSAPQACERGRGPKLALVRRDGGERLPGEQIAALVRAAAAGDAVAWEELVGEFTGLVRAVTRAHRLTDADAGDVAQSTWLRLFEHLDRINEPARVGAWLATTARRECLRVLRGAQRQVLVGDDADDYESTDAPADSALLTAERDHALWRCFGRLRGTDQRLLTLLMADERPAYEEISAALKMPVGSIGPTRARALDRLRDELDSEGSLALLAA